MDIFAFDNAIVCTVRRHGESSIIVRIMTMEQGLCAGYVRAGHARAQRPVWQPGNIINGQLKSRIEGQLASLTGELVTSRAPHYSEAMASEAISWICHATAFMLPENQNYQTLYRGCAALLDAVTLAPSARGWAQALVRYEALLLAELGFGLDLESCAVTGDEDDLAYVSPRSGRAVSRAAAQGYRKQLLRLPPFLIDGHDNAKQIVQPEDISDGLTLTGYFLKKHCFSERGQDIFDGRNRLVDRLNAALL